MLVIIGFSHRDTDRARDLLQWIGQLEGGKLSHDLVLLASSQVEPADISAAYQLAVPFWQSVKTIKQQNEDERGWPMSSNSMFQLAAQWLKENGRRSFLWLEPDAIPTQKGWLDAIAAEYAFKGRPFMGALFDKPWRHLNGVMVYPESIERWNPYMLAASDRPWDLTRHEVTMRYGHATHLIQRSVADPATNTSHTFPDAASLQVVREDAVLFHGCKDGTLIHRLRERMAMPRVPAKFVRKAAAVVRRVIAGSSYYHSGNLGDIMYGLYAVKLNGGGDLIIGPIQNGTAGCSNPVDEQQFKLLEPLLRRQSFLKRIEWSRHYPDVTVDLNKFRDNWVKPELRATIPTLCRMHCFTIGVGHKFRGDEAWLTVDRKVWTGKIIVHRSRRYLSNNFPWKKLVDKYSDQMLFVGYEDEWRKFQQDFKCRVSFYLVRDFLDMAAVISGGKCCVMNQSFPCSVAIAMGQRVFQETYPPSPDCVFERPTFLNQLG